MAKELPYYKHEPSEWLEGEIQVCSDAAIVCFTNLRDGYWLKLGCMSTAFALQKYCRRDASILQELIDAGIIDVEGDNIRIKFLDIQLHEFNSVSEKRSKAANARWKNANEMQVHSKSNAIREDKIKLDKIKEDEIVPLEKETKFIFKKALFDFGFDEKLITEWMVIRKKKGAVDSETAFNAFIREVKKSNSDINEILKICVENSWKGFKNEWLNNNQNFNNGNTEKRTREDVKSEYLSNVLSRNQQ